MLDFLSLTLSLIPFFVFIYLLIFKKTSLVKTSWATFVLTAVLVFFYWQILPDQVLISCAKGFFVALDIFVILSGAIFFLEILKRFGVIESVSYYLESFSKDYRIQVILLAWFLENFIEGTAGFGTPSAVVAPLLVGLGIDPLMAAVLSLFGNSSSVVFGAAGAPIRIGFAGLEIAGVPYYAALINMVGMIVPLFMLWLIVAGHKNRWRLFWEAVPFALWSGFVFVTFSFLMVPFGQEFPSIIGAVAGMICIFITTKLKIFVPKNVFRLEVSEKIEPRFSFWKTIFPYALLIFLLISGKLFFGDSVIKIPLEINHVISLFNPGLAFVIAGLAVSFLWSRLAESIQLGENFILKTAKFSFGQSLMPFVVIIAMSSMVQLMINSGDNFSGLPSLLETVAYFFKTAWLPVLAPLAGAFGSFLTGSATISNLLFGGLLSEAAREMLMPQNIILALILVGGAAGNMMALADMLAAETVVGLKHKERQILKSVFWPCLIYVLCAGLIGLALVRLF